MNYIIIGLGVCLIFAVGAIIYLLKGESQEVKERRLIKARKERLKKEREDKLKEEMLEIKDDIEHSPNN